MGLAGIDDAFQLRVREQARRDDLRRQMRTIGRLRRRDRGHGGGLHKLGRMGLRAGNADRLQLVFVIERGREHADGGTPVDGLVGDLDGRGIAARLRRVGSAGQRTDGDGFSAPRAAPAAPTWPAGKRHRRGEGAGNVGVDAARAMRPRRAPSPMTPTKAWGSSAGTLSITVRRVSTLVPCRAKTAPSIAAVKTTRALLLQLREGAGPGRIVGRKARARDRDETSTGPQPRERGSDMPKGGVRHGAIDMGERRERRVHQHDAGRDRDDRDDRGSARRRSGGRARAETEAQEAPPGSRRIH